MKKLTTLALIICSSLLLSACGPQKNIDNTTSIMPTSSAEQKSAFSLKDLLAKNIAQKCTWQTSGEQGDTQGEILINGNKFRQTIKMKNPMGETQFNSISDGEWMYTWSNDSTTGNMAFKIKIEQTQTETDTPQVNNGKVDWNQEFNYNCQPAVISEADLSIPKDIQFTDINDLTKQFQQ
jgi:hypothetical protein